nr:hypothetical protein [Jatrophihabitans endophyticus]
MAGADVQVAQLGARHRAAVEHLVAQLLPDVLTVLPDHQLVEGVGHSLHGIGNRTGAEVLLARDDADADQAECAFGDGCVDGVPEGTRAHVDDDVVDLAAVGFEVAQKLLEDRPLLDGLRRVAGLDELGGDDGVQVLRLREAGLPLGRDRVAPRIDVDPGVHLTRCRHT